MAFAGVLAGAAQGDALVEEHVVADDGGFADDDARAVVDDQAASDRRAGVDLHAGPDPGPLGDQPGKEAEPPAVEPMGEAVVEEGVDAGIEEEDLQSAPCGGVPALVGPKSFQQFHDKGPFPENRRGKALSSFFFVSGPQQKTPRRPPWDGEAPRRGSTLLFDFPGL